MLAYHGIEVIDSKNSSEKKIIDGCYISADFICESL